MAAFGMCISGASSRLLLCFGFPAEAEMTCSLMVQALLGSNEAVNEQHALTCLEIQQTHLG
jgi:hypothetical protein